MAPTDSDFDSFALVSTRVITPEGMAPRAVVVDRGHITSVTAPEAVARGIRVIDHGSAIVMPGIVDSHVHVNEPGRTDWEGFETATRAAAAGGITTIVDMPLNSLPSTVDVSALDAKVAAMDGKLAVDVALTGGAIPGNARELAGLAERGVVAVKAFLCNSGVTEFPHLSPSELREALRALADLGLPLFVHAELESELETAKELVGDPNDPDTVRRYAGYLASRPPRVEDEAVRELIASLRETKSRAHVVHLSSATALSAIEHAKSEGLALSVETCPHYLNFAAEEIPDGRTEFKCAPPIRERANRDALWTALGSTLIDQVVTDHSPSTPALKCSGSGDFSKAWGGISSLQLSLPAVWTEAARRGHGPERVAHWLCVEPARLVGLFGRKGVIASGADADLCVWDPDATWRAEGAALHHRHKLTPYDTREMRGAILATYLRGRPVFDGRAVSARASGRWVRRSNQ